MALLHKTLKVTLHQSILEGEELEEWRRTVKRIPEKDRLEATAVLRITAVGHFCTRTMEITSLSPLFQNPWESLGGLIKYLDRDIAKLES